MLDVFWKKQYNIPKQIEITIKFDNNKYRYYQQ